MNAEKEKKFLNWFLLNPRMTGFLLFLIFLIVTVLMVFQRYLLIQENDRREMNNIIRVVYHNIDQSLKNSVTSALTLALTIDDDGKPENFEEIGRKLLASNPGIDAVQLVPNGVITHVYPMEENQSVLGFDILNSPPHRQEALKSIEGRKMYFAGPLKLRQGGVGVVGRLPVFNKEKFWGFSAVIIRMETLIRASGINAIDDSKYYFQLSKSGPDGTERFFLPGEVSFKDAYHEVLSFPDSDWNLYLIPKNPNEAILQLVPLFVLGLMLSALFGVMITLILRKPAELQKLVYNQARNLLKSEVRFKAIFDHAPIGMAHIDARTGRFVEVNDNFVLLTGYIGEQLSQMQASELTHEDDRADEKMQLEALLRGKSRGFSMEKRINTNRGESVWVNSTVSPLWASGDTPSTYIAIVEDISIKKEAKERISKSEAHFKSLFEDSPVALWEEDFSAVRNHLEELGLMGLSPKSVMTFLRENPHEVQKCISLVRILDVNNECVVLNYPKTKQELTQGLTGLLDEESTAGFIRQLVAITSGVSGISMDTKLRRESGEVLDIHLRWGVMRGYEKTLERVMISAEDITAQKESQRIISNTQKRIETLVNTVDGIVWECDFETYMFTFINRKAEEIAGYPIEQWLSDPNFWASTIHPEDREYAVSFCAVNAEKRRQYSFEYRMIHRDGSILWIRDIVNVIHENGRPVSLRGIMIDITKAKEAEQDLNKSLQLVTEQNERLHNFSYIVSHNLRSHTANIQSIANLIESADSDEERHEMIGMLKTVSGSLNDTMVHLNDLLNIKANVGLGNESLNLRQYIDNTLAVLHEQIVAKDVVLQYDVPPSVTVDYNPAYLESILLNLLSNAIRYSDPERQPRISITWASRDHRNTLTIADNGIGIDLQKNGDKLFGMYKTFNGNPDARGIGLFITRNQIEAMGGSITVDSTPGTGTAFTIFFR